MAHRGPRMIWARKEGFREDMALKQVTEGCIVGGQIVVCEEND